MKHQQAFSLIYILIFINLMAEICLQIFFINQLQFKEQQARIKQEQLFVSTEKILNQTEKEFLVHPEHFIISLWDMQDSQNELSENWWHEHALVKQDGDEMYWIVIEKLTDLHCARFQDHAPGVAIY